MNLDTILDDWEENCAQDNPVSVDEFILRKHPELSVTAQAKLRRRIAALAAMDKALDAPSTSEARRDTGRILDQPTKTRLKGAMRLKRGFEAVPGHRLVSCLGQGGFGEVWRATAPGGFEVALKFVRIDRPGVGAASELRSVELAKRIRHPNILTVVGSWQRDGWLITSAELAGQSLYDRLQAKGQHGIPLKELLSYMTDVAKGIDYLNKRQHVMPDGSKSPIQHRDIKPQNLLLSGGGVKVADLGIARSVTHSVTGHTGALTIAYAPPEAFDNQTTDSYDQYSLAVTYCQLRGGRLPFTGTESQVMRGHIAEPPDLTMLPEEERPVVLRALAKEPNRRWPSCSKFVTALHLNSRPAAGVTTRHDSTASGHHRKWMTRWKVAVVLLLIPITIVAGYLVATHPMWDADHLLSNNPISRAMNWPPAKPESAPSIPRSDDPTSSAANRSPGKPASTPSILYTLRGHQDEVKSVTFSPDGRRIATASRDATVILWNAENGQQLQTLRGHESPVNSVTYSSDGKRIVTGSDNYTAAIWNSESGERLRTIDANTCVNAVDFSPDDQWIAMGSYGKVTVWSAKDNVIARRMSVQGNFYVSCIAFSPDGSQVACGWAAASPPIVWSAETGKPLWTLQGHRGGVNSVAYSSDGSWIATASHDHTVKMWNAQTKKVHMTLSGHRSTVYSVAFSPDCKRIVSGSFDEKAIIWDAATGSILWELRGHTRAVSAVAFSPNGSRIVTGGHDKAVIVWKLGE